MTVNRAKYLRWAREFEEEKMNEHEFQAMESAGVSRRKVEPSVRQLITSRTADEIMSLSEAGCLDREIIELILMSAIVQIENAAHEKWIIELGEALRKGGQR